MALVIGAVSALVSAVVGVFTVVRGQSFAGHALTDVATTGGSGAFFYGVSPLLGFLGAGVLGAGAMELVGVQRLRGRDVATGVVLGVATGRRGALPLSRYDEERHDGGDSADPLRIDLHPRSLDHSRWSPC